MAKKSIVEMLGSKKEETLSIQSLVELLFKAQVETHITHILQRKRLLSEHLALGEFYEGIEDMIDTLAEVAMAHEMIKDIRVLPCSEITNSEVYLKDLYVQIERYKELCNSVPFLAGKIDEIQYFISQIIYKLKYIQS